jgi:hypothetical protein
VNPASNSQFNYVQLTEWKCPDPKCLNATEFSITFNNTLNPPSAPVTPDNFKVILSSPAGNEAYECPTLLIALPELDIGPLLNLQVTQTNTSFTLQETFYNISFVTTSPIPAGGKFTIYPP